MKFINANKLHRKSGVWGPRPLLRNEKRQTAVSLYDDLIYIV
jgi:hypothetical protein